MIPTPHCDRMVAVSDDADEIGEWLEEKMNQFALISVGEFHSDPRKELTAAEWRRLLSWKQYVPATGDHDGGYMAVSNIICDFCDWLRGNHWYFVNTEYLENDDHLFNGRIASTLAEYYNIDETAMEYERRAMLAYAPLDRETQQAIDDMISNSAWQPDEQGIRTITAFVELRTIHTTLTEDALQ